MCLGGRFKSFGQLLSNSCFLIAHCVAYWIAYRITYCIAYCIAYFIAYRIAYRMALLFPCEVHFNGAPLRSWPGRLAALEQISSEAIGHQFQQKDGQ